GRFPNSHLAAVFRVGLQTFQQKSAKGGLPPSEVLVVTGRSLERASRLASDDLRRGLGALATIASTAPFVGLFGTVVGIIHAFERIGVNGAGAGFATVSQGIAEALWTTALGLVVAVPAVWMFNFLTQRIQRLQEEIESSASELLDYVADPS
ncbi:MAG TPA: MotA/TolQ/ExbB proton channel family protein, partial [Thermoanaerobaculia bacterium]